MSIDRHYSYSGEITVNQDQEFTQGYNQHPFMVPVGINSITIHFTYDPLKVRDITNVVTLGLFDPTGFRGNAHRIPSGSPIVISANTATPGFIPGQIPAGEWLAQLSIHAVVADTQPCIYQLEIDLGEGNTESITDKPWDGNQKIVQTAPAWYRGELHSHTTHSDGDCSVQGLINNAVSNDLDFLAITDHNTVSTLYELNKVDFKNLLIIPGFELTTFHGHALALGIDRWVDWRTGYKGWTINDAAQKVRELGGVFILAHPNDIGSPRCTGCKWEYSDINFDLVDAVEIWNSGWWEGEGANVQNLTQWHQRQNGSPRLPITAGTDYHQSNDWKKPVAYTYVFADELTVEAILDGIRKGRIIISSGPWLSLRGLCASDQYGGIGDTISTANGKIEVSVSWKDAPAYSELLINTQQGVKAQCSVSGNGSDVIAVDVLDKDSIWLELYSRDHTLLAITNPIFSIRE